jgi:integral membrane protein
MSELKKFRLINKIEGISFLILLFIAMPMKYSFGIPMATKIVGMLHGLLVFAFIYQIIEAKKEAGFTMKETVLYSVLSLIPFGSFYTDKLLAKKMTVA